MKLKSITHNYWRQLMMVNLNKNEMWKILDAIVAYKKDYAVSGVVEKTLNNIQKKLKDYLQNS